MKNYSRIFNTSLMNSDVTYSFKELMMGHSVKLDDIYYDKDNEKSQQKILLEYMKAIDALTITFTLYRAHSFLCLSIFRIFLSNQQTPFQQSLPYYIASKVHSYSGHYLTFLIGVISCSLHAGTCLQYLNS